MRSNARTGQAALEYLVTYGWGFVILLVVVGALAYMGFLSPSRYVPARCEFGSQLECVDYKLEQAQQGVRNGRVQLRFRNNFGDDINITHIQTVNGLGSIPGQIKVKKGNVTDAIIFDIPPSDPTVLVKDDRASVPLIITFQRDRAGAPKHNVTGEIFATVQ